MSRPNIIFVNPSLAYNGRKCEEVVFPFASVMFFATILNREGYEVKMIDGNRYDAGECIRNILGVINSSTLYIGLSVMTSQVPWAYKVTREIKRLAPTFRIIWGGTHPTLYPEQTIADEAIDIVVVNEAFSTIAALTKTIEVNGDLSKIPGIYFKSGKGVIKTADYIPDDIKKIPECDFSLFDVGYYANNNMLAKSYNIPLEKVIALPLLTGLGCVYKCTFCINVILDRKYRFRSAEEIVDSIEFLQKTYGANFFQFLDEDFFISKKRIFDFIDLVEKRRLKFYFRPWLRVSYFRNDYISLDVAKRLEKVGMLTAVMGAECGSQTILDRIRKQIKVEDTIKAAEILSRTNIVPRFSMMVGLPGETMDDILATYRLALKLKRIDRRADIPILSFAAYPGSPIYKDAVKDYNLKEPLSLADWAKLDFSGFLGFYSVQGKPWISDKKRFQRMEYYYNLGFNFGYKKAKLSTFIHNTLKQIIRLRFNLGWFGLPMEDYLLKTYRNIKSYAKADTAPPILG